MHNSANQQIYLEAGLSAEEIRIMPAYIEGSSKEDFIDSTAYEKLFEYFAFETGEMPYQVAKARTETPDMWILDYLEPSAQEV